MTQDQVSQFLGQVKQLGTCEWIYFEGGEPFLFYTLLLNSVKKAAEAGFKVGLVSNAYWATARSDAEECLRPLAGLVQDLSISSDLFHGEELVSGEARNALEAARDLEIPCSLIAVDDPCGSPASQDRGELPICHSSVSYRGRAASALSDSALPCSWQKFAACPDEDLDDPGRVHVDVYGNVHICQGLSIGNLLETPLEEICRNYDPETHPIIRHLLKGGPAELRRAYEWEGRKSYADACHLCYEIRRSLMERFPDLLTPPAVYGV